MLLNQAFIKLLSELADIGNPEINKYLKVSSRKAEIDAEIKIDSKTLAKVSEKSILLNDELDLQDDLTAYAPAQKTQNANPQKKFKKFLKQISQHITRLNHIGLQYFSNDVLGDIKTLNKSLDDSPFALYEESNDDPHDRWLFAGNIDNWRAPMFEIVLSKRPTTRRQKWYLDWFPGIQIDLDTTAVYEELRPLLNETLGRNFISFIIDVPNYEKVLIMGNMGKVDGVNIHLALGTEYRSTAWHRRNSLTKL